MSSRRPLALGLIALLLAAGMGDTALAHAIEGKDAAFVAETKGAAILPFMYLGAKHMVTGYDHLLFLIGVIFFLFRFRDIALYVTLFSVGHSITLLFGALTGIGINPWLVDAVIGLSVVYKAFENLGGFKTLFGFQPDTRVAVLVFGLIHGFGLASKLQALRLHPDGLVTNLLSFNIGVEIGQALALSLILLLMLLWRRSRSFTAHAAAANSLIMAAGMILIGYQLSGYFLGGQA